MSAQGYMSAANVFAQPTNQYQTGDTITYRDLSARSVLDQKHDIRSFCNDHPLSTYIDAVINLYRSLPAKTTRFDQPKR
jgi:hypothetical protein